MQIKRVFSFLMDKVGSFKRISSQFDILIVYMLKKVTKYNAETLKAFNWEELSCFVFEQILPGSLKIPSPVKGARKISKLLTKSDVPYGEEFFETLGNNIPSRIAKWIVYTMRNDCYSLSVHDKLMFFLDSLRSLCHPSNHGQWSVPIELFLGYFAGTLAKQTNKNEKWLNAVSEDLVSEIVEKIWNLSELLVFARSGPALSGMCISSFTCINLANIRPQLIVPKMMLAVSGALESVSEPHRTISAIGLLQVSMPNLMKSPVGIVSVLSLLPTVVFGIDSNDQLKSIRTLSMFLSFSEAARIEDISELSFECLDEWTDSCQEAKELTGQFSDVFLLFTENVISYLRTISQGTSNEHDDLSRMILAISNCVYARVSGKIAQICLEKWLELLEEDLGKMVTEVVGEIVSKIAKNHDKENSLVGKLIPKLLQKISEQIERGDGQLGSKDQSNNSLNNNLIILSHLLENSKEYLKSHSKELNEVILNILTVITNRKSFLAGSRLFHSITMCLIHHEIKELRMNVNGSNPFSAWARWLKVEDLVEGQDFEYNLATECDGLLALETIEAVLNWTRSQISSVRILNSASLSKSESERLFCLLQVIDNVNIDLLSVYNSFSSYNYGINSELNSDNVAHQCLVMLKGNLDVLKSLHPIIEASGNLELEISLVEIIGSIINGHPVNPDKSREKLKAIKRLNINYDRFHTDKDRPVSFWILKAEAQFKLRRDLRFDLGDSQLEAEMMVQFDEFAGILFNYCFKPYHMLRISAQNSFRMFTHKYMTKSRGYILKILESIETSANISESVFKGVCFMLRNRFADIICEDFELVDKFLRGLLKLSEMPVAQEVNESFEILNGTLNVFSDAYVPDLRDVKVKVKQLVLDLITFAEGRSEKWTSQYLAMLSAHPMIEMCDIPEIFTVLAKFSLSKVAIIRNVAQNCFKVAIYGQVKNNLDCEKYWEFKDLTALKMARRQIFAQLPEICLKTWQEDEFKEISEFLREYLKFLCLPTDDDEGSGGEGLQFEYMNFAYLGRWISLFGEAELNKFMEIIELIFMKESLDLGHQRALCEVICAIICNKGCNENLMRLLRKSWNGLAIENLELWTCAINEPLMWNETVLKEVYGFFEASTIAGNETARIILGMKMISKIYSQFEGEVKWFDVRVLSDKLLKLCTHEYTSIVMESSKLLALISMKNPCLRDETILPELFEKRKENDNVSRAILQFFACSSTLNCLTEFWSVFSDKLADILEILASEKVQMLTDAKKALLTLFLTKGGQLANLNNLAQITLRYSAVTGVPVKISKFCIELVQLLVQNNFALFHPSGSVENFFKLHVDRLIESDQLHLRESSHGLILSLYQIDPKKSIKDVEMVTKRLQMMKNSVKSELRMKERHGIVLRGSGIILAEPHVLSKTLPALLTALSFYISDRSPISPLVRLTFNEFRRTHQDTWNMDRQLFDEDQLDAIGELLIAPSYYA